MKKIFSLALALIMMCSCVFAFSACGDTEDVVKYINFKLTDEQYAYGVNKGDAELLSTVNSVLTEINSNGTLNEIIEKYFSNDTENIKKFPAGKVDSSKNQLVVATNTPFSPFEYKNTDGTYSGIDIEIAKMIADEMEAELVISEMDFSAILTAVETGKADIAMAGLTVNPKREKQVTFSQTYYEASQVVIVRSDDTRFAECTSAEDVEAVLNSLPANTVIGYQNGTTGGLYIEGDEDWGFAGFNVDGRGYKSAVMATEALVNGQISLVVVDEGPAQIIVNSFNK